MNYDNTLSAVKMKSGNWGQSLATLRLGLACIAFLLGLLTLVPIPHSVLWAPSVLISEWGHLGAIVPILLLFGKRHLLRSRLAFILAICALGFLLSPLIRAVSLAQKVPGAMTESFGNVVPRSYPDAPYRPQVIVAMDLFNISMPKVRPETYTFKAGLTLDLYRRKAIPGRLPVIVVVHGGSWQHGDSNQIPAVNQYLARRGYAVAAVNYRKAPADPFPAARDDVVAAIAYLKLNADKLLLDPERIVLLGRSAGGQLVLVVAYGIQDPAIRGVVSLYAPTDMVWSWENPGNPLVIKAHKLLWDYLGGSPDQKLTTYRKASPWHLVHASAPPTLMLHGNRDEMVWPRQSERLMERLDQFRVNHLFLPLGWAEHGFDANLWGPGGQIYLYVLERFLASVM